MPNDSLSASPSRPSLDARNLPARRARARRLYQWGQGVAALGGPDASRRALRLYRRGLRVLGVSCAPLSTVSSETDANERQALRAQLHAELARSGLPGLAARKPLAVYSAAGVLALLLLLPKVLEWLEPDLAEGKVWTASSNWGPFPITGVMAGDAMLEGRFHTNDELTPWVSLDLGQVYDVHAVYVENRANCCRERAVPLRVELSADNKSFWRVAYRRALFERFTARFAKTKARYVRLVVDRRSTLHLRRIAVY